MAKTNLIIPQAQNRTVSDLIRLQKLPLEQKIELSLRRIHQWYSIHRGQVYGAFSGGKDSTVLMDLIWKQFPEVPAVFSNTGLEYPEIVDFVKEIQKTKPVEIIKPKLTFKEVIDKYGWAVVSKEQSQFINDIRNSKSEKLINTRLNGNKYGRGKISNKHKYLIDAPFKISEKCCDALKKYPFKRYEKQTKRLPIIGTMADESQLRQQSWIKDGCNAFNSKRPKSAPMAFWTEQDVLNYIVKYNLPYCDKIYGNIIETKLALQMDMFGAEDEKQVLKCEKANRTGCMFCMFGLEHETKKNDGENRFTRMKYTHPKQYNYVINKIGGKEILDFMNLPY